MIGEPFENSLEPTYIKFLIHVEIGTHNVLLTPLIALLMLLKGRMLENENTRIGRQCYRAKAHKLISYNCDAKVGSDRSVNTNVAEATSKVSM